MESELVSGFMTEHAAVIFVFFFLAEYGSIVLICILNTILFLGGYLLDYTLLLYILQETGYEACQPFNSPVLEGMLSGMTMGVKSCVMIFIFIWTRASFPRIRFDQLMSFSWTILLPIVIAFIVFIPCVVYSFDILPSNISLL